MFRVKVSKVLKTSNIVVPGRVTTCRMVDEFHRTKIVCLYKN